MRVIEFSGYGPPEVLKAGTRTFPAPMAGQVSVDVAASGVNPADGKWRSGMFRDMAPLSLPHIPGYDVAGIVSALGEGVDGVAVGDRVVIMLHPFTAGGYAERVLAEAGSIARLPDALDLELAASLPTPALTGVQMIREYIRPDPGETVLITGALGAVGRFALQTALEAGAVVIAAVRADQVDEALLLGAADTIVIGQPVAAGVRFDHVADTVGGPDVAALCRFVGHQGRIVNVATTPIDPTDLPVVPTFMGVRPDGAMLASIVHALGAGRLTTLPVRAMPLGEAAEAQRLVEAGGLRARIVLKP
jgi:NADPH2:quinone reductase